jgi:branched-chain amino acid transport system substrate-binding protein
METGWCQDISKDIRRVLKESGKWELVVDMGHEYGNTEYGPQLIKIRKENPAAIFLITYAPVEAVSFMNQFLENPTESLIFMTYVPSVPEFLELLGKDKAEGLFWGSQETLYGTPEQEAYREKFKKRFGREPGSSNVYDVVKCWAAAVRKAGDPSDYRAVIKALTTYSYEGLLGTYDLSEETHYGKEGADYIAHRFFQIQGGKHKILYLHDRRYLGKGDYKGTFELPPWVKTGG